MCVIRCPPRFISGFGQALLLANWIAGPAALVAVDVPLDQAQPDEYDGLVLPGGVVNADTLRTDMAAQEFTKAFDAAGKPIAVVCHGNWTSSRKPDDLPAFNREFIAALQRAPAKREIAMPIAD